MSAENVQQREQTSRAAHDPETPKQLIEFMSGNWIDLPLAAHRHPQLARLQIRRETLSRAYPGWYLVIPAGEERVRANDTSFRFRTSSDFAYLMGEGEPGSILVMEPEGSSHRSLLFAPAHNRGNAEFFTDRRYGELWVGRHRGLDESQTYFGIDRCRPLEEIRPYLNELRANKHPVRILHEQNHGVDECFTPTDDDADFVTFLSEMRLVKDEYEIAELRKACEITKRGFEDVIRLFPHARSEREVEAAFWSRARIEANDVGYLTIAGAGEHACTLHWTRNNGTLQRNALLLLDAGVECDSLYTADVTRTLPVSGRFTPDQRAVYEIVWEAQRQGFAAVAAGNDFVEPNRRAMRVLAEGLIDLGILRMSLDEALDPEKQFYRRYTLHAVSHMLGLDVHDCARARSQEYRYGKLREGMVLTVEPGLYFQPDDATVPERFRGIGVRIEDDVVVTAGGCENLSAMLPSQADAVESWVSGVTSQKRS
jgi:Xaa-Pro aminopeptidase